MVLLANPTCRRPLSLYDWCVCAMVKMAEAAGRVGLTFGSLFFFFFGQNFRKKLGVSLESSDVIFLTHFCLRISLQVCSQAHRRTPSIRDAANLTLPASMTTRAFFVLVNPNPPLFPTIRIC